MGNVMFYQNVIQMKGLTFTSQEQALSKTIRRERNARTKHYYKIMCLPQSTKILNRAQRFEDPVLNFLRYHTLLQYWNKYN